MGNYLGAVKGMLELQNNPEFETFYMVADAHTITTPYNVEELRKNRREVILDYLAAGLDPEKSVIFQQAEVGEHFELAFYLSSVTTIAKMQHLPTFKEKVKQYPEHSTMALLNYPVLMAADILLYKADQVPVGIDQEPHLEVAREIARRFNQDYGMDFPEPVRFVTRGEYVPSLTGEGKMSKSVEGSYINLTDSLEEIKSKIAKIPTDDGQNTIHLDNGLVYFKNSTGEMPPALSTLVKYINLFVDSGKREELTHRYPDGIRYGELKSELAEAIYKELQPMQQKRRELEQDRDYVNSVIEQGAQKARAAAQETLREVKEKMGLK